MQWQKIIGRPRTQEYFVQHKVLATTHSKRLTSHMIIWNLLAAHTFNYIVLRVNPGLTSCEDLATALLSFIHCISSWLNLLMIHPFGSVAADKLVNKLASVSWYLTIIWIIEIMKIPLHVEYFHWFSWILSSVLCTSYFFHHIHALLAFLVYQA